MRPAFSVIFLTTLIGAGQGLFLALFTAQSYALFGLLPVAGGRQFHAAGSLLAVLLLVAGLAASFFHLGHPERAWRAAAQWRTSWLSREVLALPAFTGAVLLFGLAHWLGWQPVLLTLPSGIAIDATVVLGGVATLLAFTLFVCTGMVYACLRFLREWHTPLTVINFVLLGGASGFALATLLATVSAPGLVVFFADWTLIITLLAGLGRGAALFRNARLRQKSTLQSAIGIKHPRLAQASQGFIGGSFNTREFFHGRPARTLAVVKWLFLATLFVLPVILLPGIAHGGPSNDVIMAALVVVFQVPGLLAERWLFFAEARHPQNLYYGKVA